jgi:1-deoxy-D-xylulose-5-phosphate synthase
MATGCSLTLMMKKMPNRAFDVGIAEQHAVTFSAGLAKQGMLPFCNIYSTFAQRAYDQIIHDVALQNLHVVFCFDRGGLVGNDGATHHGAYDLGFMRSIPNIVVSAPMDEIELRHLMFTAQLPENNFPFSIRYPRGKGIHVKWKVPFEEIPIGAGRLIKSGEHVAFLSIGTIGNKTKVACDKLMEEGIDAAHYDLRFVKPLDTKLLEKVFAKFANIITIEDGAIMGGFGSAILEYANTKNYHGTIIRLGIPDKFVEHGTQQQLIEECGYDLQSMINAAKNLVKI